MPGYEGRWKKMTFGEMVEKLESIAAELKEQSVPPGPQAPEGKDVTPLNLGEEVEIWMPCGGQGWQKTTINGVNTALNECSTDLGPTIRLEEENVRWRRVWVRCETTPQAYSPGVVGWAGSMHEHCDVSPHGITSKDVQIANLNAKITNLESQLETEQMKLAACGGAALSNTRLSFDEKGIDDNNLYWSTSYEAVRTAVKREMNYRESCEELGKAFDRLEGEYKEQKRKTGLAELEVLQIKAALEKALTPLTDSPYPVVETAVKFLEKGPRIRIALNDEEKKAFRWQVIPVIANAVESFARDSRCHGTNVWANKIENTVNDILKNVVEELKV